MRLEVAERLRQTVWRARVTGGPPEAPRTVILRLGPGRAGVAASPSERARLEDLLAREWAGTVLLARVQELRESVPRLLAGAPARGLLVCEDVGAGPSLADLLLGDDADAAERGLLAHATLWGRLVAAGRERVEEYRELAERAGAAGSASLLEGTSTRALHELAASLGAAAPAGVEQEFARARALHDEPGEWEAYSPADACPDNNVIADGRVRVFDFGFGHPRHLALDAAYAALPFPHCWCAAALPRQLRVRLVEAFRAPVAERFAPAADEAAFGRALADATVLWLAGPLAQRALRALPRDWRGRGPVSQRQVVVAHLEAAVDWLSGHCPASAGLAGDLAGRLRRAWRLDGALPAYPALR